MIRYLVALALLIFPAAGLSQNTSPEAPAVLIADEVFITAERELVARGNVEAFQGNVRVEASEIRYSRKTGDLVITGPIRIQDGESVVILAESADLDASLQTGLITSARIVIDQQLQLATAQVQRVDDRYSQLYKTAVTSCKTCDDGKPPLWQIRARRIIHDKQERQLYFDQAQLRIGNVPVLYFPRLRLPDPTVERATGFLIPSWRQNSDLGLGIKVPYFVTLGDHRDITFTPYVSGKTKTLELRYRQAFVNGEIEFDGAISRDDLRRNKTRGYFFGQGNFDLRNDFKLRFYIIKTTDDAYLQEYDYSGADRLVSQLLISRAKRDEYVAGTVINYESLRDSERNSQIPSVIGDLFYQRRFFPAVVGGEFRFTTNLHGHKRYSDDDIVGRDEARFNTEAIWLNNYTFRGGLRAEAQIGLAADLFDFDQDSQVDGNQSQVTPFTSLALRYPMIRTEQSGATQFLEPIAQLAWTGNSQLDIPNEESTLVDFDDGNLFSLSRFPAPDRRERNGVFAYGINWSRFAPTGTEHALTVGQVLRAEDESDFTESSGLSGTSSDILVAGQIKTENGLEMIARTLVDTSFDFTKAEVLGAFENERGGIAGSYIWLVEDPAENRFLDTSEIFLDGFLNLNNSWRASGDWRYDLIENRASEAGIGLAYTNECVEVDFSVRRRYGSSSSFDPATTFGLSIGLRGFSARSGTEKYSRSCG